MIRLTRKLVLLDLVLMYMQDALDAPSQPKGRVDAPGAGEMALDLLASLEAYGTTISNSLASLSESSRRIWVQATARTLRMLWPLLTTADRDCPAWRGTNGRPTPLPKTVTI